MLSLFDSGASHYFISNKFVADNDVPHVKLDSSWEISTGNGVITTDRICKACVVEICGKKLKAYLFVINTGG